MAMKTGNGLETRTGVIVKLLLKRGFGFILQEDGTSIFFHAAGVIGEFSQLREGMPVSYCVVDDEGRRPRAIAVVEEM